MRADRPGAERRETEGGIVAGNTEDIFALANVARFAIASLF
jgi:hypothetical protein